VTLVPASSLETSPWLPRFFFEDPVFPWFANGPLAFLRSNPFFVTPPSRISFFFFFSLRTRPCHLPSRRNVDELPQAPVGRNLHKISFSTSPFCGEILLVSLTPGFLGPVLDMPLVEPSLALRLFAASPLDRLKIILSSPRRPIFLLADTPRFK